MSGRDWATSRPYSDNRLAGAGQWLSEQIAQRVTAGLDVLIVVRGGAW